MTAVMPKVVGWRRDIHEHPELSGDEVRTAALVAAHLTSLGMDVTTGVGGHGVVGLLRGVRPGPVVALRADMAALVDLPFRSTVKSTYRGQAVGVMHACGHDNHVAILMGAAEVLAGMKAMLPGTVKFVFQPADEGAPNGEGVAAPMIRAGVLEYPHVDAMFGLRRHDRHDPHIRSDTALGHLRADDAHGGAARHQQRCQRRVCGRQRLSGDDQ